MSGLNAFINAEKLDRAFLTFLNFVWQFDRGYRPGIDALRQAPSRLHPISSRSSPTRAVNMA